MIRLLQRPWTFLMSIKFGVCLIIFLMLTMMIATQFEASTSTRAMKHFIYGSKWFDAAVFLFVVNIVVNTLRRRPYGFRHIGFLTVHTGILVCVTGGLASRYFAVDGSMPIPEGAASREISLPENDLVVEAGGRTVRHDTHYELKPWENEHADLYDVPGTPYRLRVDRYYPTGTVADTLLHDPAAGQPTLRLAIGVAGHEPTASWLRVGDSERSAVTHGPVRVRVASPSEAEGIRKEWKSAPSAPSAGKLRVFWKRGGSDTFDVPLRPGASFATSVPGVRVEIVQVFRAFMLADGGAVDASDKPENPACRFRVLRPDGREEHLSFSKFPEFKVDPPEGESWLVTHGAWEPAAGLGGFEREVLIEHAGEGRWLTWTSGGDPSDGAVLDRDETRELANAGVLLRVLEAADHGVLARVVVKESDEVQRPVLLVRLVQESGGDNPAEAAFLGALRRETFERAATEPNEVWLFHGESFRFETPSGPLDVYFRTRNIPLDFAIHLDDFREETYPGISLAASYESHVTVQPSAGEAFQEKIYMNHPLKYAGYVFYQASFQRTPDGEITVLSVAKDPGMKISFVGYCILVAGLLLIFFAKPYLRKLDDRRANRTANAGG